TFGYELNEEAAAHAPPPLASSIRFSARFLPRHRPLALKTEFLHACSHGPKISRSGDKAQFPPSFSGKGIMSAGSAHPQSVICSAPRYPKTIRIGNPPTPQQVSLTFGGQHDTAGQAQYPTSKRQDRARYSRGKQAAQETAKRAHGSAQ